MTIAERVLLQEPRKPLRVLLVEDNPGDARLVRELLRDAPEADFELHHVASVGDAIAALGADCFDVVLLDLALPDSEGLETLERVLAAETPAPVVVITGLADESIALQAVNRGAQDYVVKGAPDGGALARSLRYAVERHRALCDLRAANAREAWLATHDFLTGLPSRYTLLDRLSQATARAARQGQRLVLLFIDLDAFKAVNDTYGHGVGDRVLKEVAARLSRRVRKSDTPARLGGDEFAVLAEDVGEPDNAARVAAALRESLDRPHRIDGRDIVCRTSIGIVISPEEGSDPEALLRKADAAMYHAKQRGGGYAFYDAAMEAASQRALVTERALRRMLDRRSLRCHYQRQVDAAEGRILGAEALARWRDPSRGWVLPAEFIPLAERRGLIAELGECVLRTACREARKWDPSLRISVNVSPKQLARPGFAGIVESVLEETGLPPWRLELEITESALMHDERAGRAAVVDLKKLGARISIDDFGTGYSCLSALKRLPVDAVKIDRCFVRDALTDPVDAAVIDALLGIARQLELETLVEGVETKEQCEFLLARGCRRMQGYFFGEPVPPGKLDWSLPLPSRVGAV